MSRAIILPWPNAVLSPNARSRSHWPRTKALAKARRDGSIAAQDRAVGLRQLRESIEAVGPIQVAITFYPANRRARDVDNLVASLKGYIDGICDALGVDDARFEPSYSMAEPDKANPRVEIVVGAPA